MVVWVISSVRSYCSLCGLPWPGAFFLWFVCMYAHVARFLALVLRMLHLTVPVSEPANVPGVRSLVCNSWGFVSSEQSVLFMSSRRLEFKTVSCFDFCKNKSFQKYKWKTMALFSAHIKCRWIFSIHLKQSMGKCVVEAGRALNL